MNSSSSEMRLSEDDLRQISLYAAKSARQALSIFEAKYPPIVARAKLSREQKLSRRATSGPRHCTHERGRQMQPLATPKILPPSMLLGSAIHQARPLELAAGSDEDVGQERLRWAVDHASPTVRAGLRRMSTVHGGRRRFSEILRDLDAELRR